MPPKTFREAFHRRERDSNHLLKNSCINFKLFPGKGAKFAVTQKVYALRTQLTWTHLRSLVGVKEVAARPVSVRTALQEE